MPFGAVMQATVCDAFCWLRVQRKNVVPAPKPTRRALVSPMARVNPMPRVNRKVMLNPRERVNRRVTPKRMPLMNCPGAMRSQWVSPGSPVEALV